MLPRGAGLFFINLKYHTLPFSSLSLVIRLQNLQEGILGYIWDGQQVDLIRMNQLSRDGEGAD